VWMRAVRSQFPPGRFDISDADAGFLDITVPLMSERIQGLLSDPQRQLHRNQSVWKRLRHRFHRDQSSPVRTQSFEFDSDWWSRYSVVTVRGPAHLCLSGDSTVLGDSTCRSPFPELD
jgi:hypothetical protein